MRHSGKKNGMKKARHSKRKQRKGKLCWRCNKGKLEFCDCGCKARIHNNLLCKTCWYSNF